jgi:nicotinamidase-related amidase
MSGSAPLPGWRCSSDLDAWLRERGIDAIAVWGIQTNYCWRA